MTTGSRVVGYVRVSTEGQVEHGHSLDEQAEQITSWCAQHGYELVAIYREEGVTGRADGMADRDAYAEMLADLEEQGDVAGVVFYSLQRLARDLMLQETIIVDLQRRGYEPHSVTEPDLCSDEPSRVAFRQMMGVFNQWDRAMLVARLEMGRRRKRRAGGYVGGYIPLGYRVQGQGSQATVEIDEAEAQIVRRVFREYLGHGRGGASMREIARGLTEDGVPTQRGGTWAQAQIGVILVNEAYTGATGLPRIIEPAQFERVTRRRAKRR